MAAIRVPFHRGHDGCELAARVPKRQDGLDSRLGIIGFEVVGTVRLDGLAHHVHVLPGHRPPSIPPFAYSGRPRALRAE
jgi:hypothetical protein